MHLIQIDMIGLQAAQRILTGLDDVVTAVARSFGPAPISPWTFVASTTSSRRPFC